MAVEASGEVIFMTDAGGTITYVNAEFVRLYGYQPDEIVGRTTPRILKSGETSADEYSALWTHLSRNQVVRGEFVNRTKCGDLVTVESTANPIFTDRGRVGFIAVQRDITARKAAEAALAESERRYRTLAEAAHDSIFIVDREACITYANAAAVEQFGVQVQDAIGRRLHDVFAAAAAVEMWRQLSAVFTTGERKSFEARFDGPHGELWLETWLVPMTRAGGDADAVMGLARNVTARKLLERQLLQAQKMEALGQLAGGIAHDFNNLLTAILGYTELLFERIGHDAALAADLEQISKAGARAARLTRQLLAFGRKQMLAVQIVDMNEVVTELHKMLGRIIGEDVHLHIVTAPDLERVQVDPGQMEQVIVNLAVNARDAMPRGGTLRISTENVKLDEWFTERHPGATAGSHVALSVQDTGSGMTPEVLAHVFEPFFTTKPVGKGTGLGLATVYGIVKQSGGHITLDSSPGQGTTVRVYFPSVTQATSADAPAAVTAWMRGTGTILLVEDDAGVRDLMQRTLEQVGYTVLKAETAAAAVAIAMEPNRHLDLLLSDVIMPDLSGPDVAQRVVRVHPAIRVLYVSGFTNQISLDSGTLSRRAAFLAKPFTSQALTRKVHECLHARF
jgi:two-component system cell cycle sensor histidine kinase/response regulator CckA